MGEQVQEKRNKMIIIIASAVLAVALLVAGLFWIFSETKPESSDTGKDQARILYEIGVLPAYDGVYLAKAIAPQDVEQSVLSLLGCGEADHAGNFYRYLTMDLAPEFTFPKEKESITETELYGYLLRALGFVVADEEILVKAKEVGFGFLREVRDSGEPLTNGIFATILYEAMFVRPENPEHFTTARILAYLNSDFKDILLQNGLFDDIPETYIPLFNNGVYKQDSFGVLPSEDGRNEWTAVYLAADTDYVTAYIEGLLAGGWTREGTYLEEGELSATIELLYRPLPEDETRELAVAMRYDTAGTVELALFLN